jgi:hypothetical protein
VASFQNATKNLELAAVFISVDALLDSKTHLLAAKDSTFLILNMHLTGRIADGLAALRAESLLARKIAPVGLLALLARKIAPVGLLALRVKHCARCFKRNIQEVRGSVRRGNTR